jgi:hypothetical protein
MEEVRFESGARAEVSAEVPEAPAEAPSMWQAKPWWCQPWSIVLTGIVIVVASWLLLHRLWITLPVASVILVWWFLFLKLVPDQYAAAVIQITDKGDF